MVHILPGRPAGKPDQMSPIRTAVPYTPRHNGKVERYQRILAEELLYAREFTSEDARSSAIAIWNIHSNYHRPQRSRWAAASRSSPRRRHQRSALIQLASG